MLNRHFALALTAISFIACQKLTTVKVSPPSAKITKANGSVPFVASQLDADGQPMKEPAPVAWASSDNAIASVDAAGVATAKKSGKVTVIAKVAEVEGRAQLDIHIPAKIIVNGQKTVAPTSLTVTIGTPLTLTADVADDAGNPMPDLAKGITVATANPTIATVAGAPGGPKTITGVSPGQTKIVITAADGKVTASLDVIVKGPDFASIKVDPAELKLKVGADSKIVATALAADSKPVAGVTFTFASEDAKVATVDAAGTVHGVAKGKTSVTVKSGDKSAAVPVVVAK